jgi:hypothetical protein
VSNASRSYRCYGSFCRKYLDIPDVMRGRRSWTLTKVVICRLHSISQDSSPRDGQLRWRETLLFESDNWREVSMRRSQARHHGPFLLSDCELLHLGGETLDFLDFR